MLYSYKTIINQDNVYPLSWFRVPFGQKFPFKCFTQQQFCGKDVLRTTEARRFRQEPNNLIWISGYIYGHRFQRGGERVAHQSFIHDCAPSVKSGKACGSGCPLVLGRSTTAAVRRLISARGVVCPSPTNAINICFDGGVRTSCAPHFSFSCRSWHVHLCWIPPLLSPLQTLGKVIILATLHALHFGLSFLFFCQNPTHPNYARYHHLTPNCHLPPPQFSSKQKHNIIFHVQLQPLWCHC